MVIHAEDMYLMRWFGRHGSRVYSSHGGTSSSSDRRKSPVQARKISDIKSINDGKTKTSRGAGSPSQMPERYFCGKTLYEESECKLFTDAMRDKLIEAVLHRLAVSVKS
jgi:hypothetical protein